MNRSCRHCSPDKPGHPCRESCIYTNMTVCYGWGNVRQLLVCAHTSQGGSCVSAGMLWAWQHIFYKGLCRCSCNGAAYPELKAGDEPRPARPLFSAGNYQAWPAQSGRQCGASSSILIGRIRPTTPRPGSSGQGRSLRRRRCVVSALWLRHDRPEASQLAQ